MSERRPLMRGDPNHQREFAELVQIVAAAELLRPSRRLWLAASELANSPILDNRAGAFSSLEPTWSERWIGAFELFARNLALGGEIVVVTSPESTRRLEMSFPANPRLFVRTLPLGAATGIAGDGYWLTGKLAWLPAGVAVVEEGVFFENGATAGERAATVFAQSYGDVP